MVTNFEEHTADLSEDEMIFKDDVKRHLEFFLEPGCKPYNQASLANMIEHRITNEHGRNGIKINVTRLRKYFNYFRTNGVLPIIATSNGCYISNNKEEIQKQILSLEERARQISRAANGMKKFLL